MIIPAEQIVEKTEERDFAFFLDHGNFFKVVDTLEKFEVNMVNKESQAGRDFVLFKRQLYQMYEVRHRSIWEHEQFSLTVERRNLKWLAEANRDFIHEIHRINHLDQLADTSRLVGKVFKKKMFNEAKIKGIGAFGLAAFGYMNMTAFTLMMGPLAPSAAIVGSLMYGMNQFAERQTIKDIEALADGQMKITFLVSPFVTETLTAHINDMYSVCALGDDDLGADDVEANLLAIQKFTYGKNQEIGGPITLTLPADAFRDKPMMEWMLAKKDDGETTNDDFTDLLKSQFETRVQKGGLGMITSFHVKTTGLAQFARDKEVEV